MSINKLAEIKQFTKTVLKPQHKKQELKLQNN